MNYLSDYIIHLLHGISYPELLTLSIYLSSICIFIIEQPSILLLVKSKFIFSYIYSYSPDMAPNIREENL